MALDDGDPLLNTDEGTFAGQGIASYTRPQMRALHDPSVSFEEYHYYAKQTCTVEDANMEDLILQLDNDVMNVDEDGNENGSGEDVQGHI